MKSSFQRSFIKQASRRDRTRTCNNRFWRPGLYQLSYSPIAPLHQYSCSGTYYNLTRFRVFVMRATLRTKLLQAQAVFDVLFVLGRLVIARLAFGAGQRQNRLILGCHFGSFLLQLTSTAFQTELKKPPAGIEPAAATLPMWCSTDELQGRTRLRIWDCELRIKRRANPQSEISNPQLSARGRIRTAVPFRDQIYSLTPLTTRPPVRKSACQKCVVICVGASDRI